MSLRGQGALEYLLMIGAGIAIAAVVLYFVLSAGAGATCESYKSQVAGLCAAKSTWDICERTGDISDLLYTGAGISDPEKRECEWVAGSGGSMQCIVKAGLNWDDSGYCS